MSGISTCEHVESVEANELTHSAAHHLPAIYGVGLPYGGWARVAEERCWVETDEHRLVKLSQTGLKAAYGQAPGRQDLFRRRPRIPESQAEVDSCKIEHLVTDATGERWRTSCDSCPVGRRPKVPPVLSHVLPRRGRL